MPDITYPAIEQAIDIARRELDIGRNERKALRRFLARLHGIDQSRLESNHPAASHPVALQIQRGSDRDRPSGVQAEIIKAYETTILRLDHYDDEYGNPIREDIELELGPSVASALFDRPRLSEVAFQFIIEQITTSISQRTVHIQALRCELESLETCRSALRDVELDFVDWPAPSELSGQAIEEAHTELETLENRCQEILRRRQEALHSGPGSAHRGVDAQSLSHYLYDSRLPSPFPVLHDGLSVYSAIRDYREQYEGFLPESSTSNTGSNER